MLEKVDELKQKSEDIKREAAIRKRQEEEAKRRLEELQAAQVDADAKFASLDEEINVSAGLRSTGMRCDKYLVCLRRGKQLVQGLLRPGLFK